MIAILGANGTIGFSLARELVKSSERLVLFARNPKRLGVFRGAAQVDIQPLSEFDARQFELVINAIGDVDHQRVVAAGIDHMNASQIWDERVLDTMTENTAYTFISSGAVTYVANGDERSSTLTPYVLAKINAESRHRMAVNRPILDARVFGYVDIAMSIDSTFFLSELASSIVRKQPFITSPQEMVRDYTGADELLDLIQCWRNNGAPNIALDLFSKMPASKHELLKIAKSRYGLKIEARDAAKASLIEGTVVYASRDHSASKLGYSPKRSATDVVIATLDALYQECRGK